MMKKHSLLACVFFYLNIILLATSNTFASKLTDDSREYTYDPSFYWGEQHEDWSECKQGNQQSPININEFSAIKSDEILYMDAGLTYAVMHSTGHKVQVLCSPGGGSVTFNHKTYFLSEGHWHIPSEHTFDNKSYPLELHLVHKTYDGTEILVVGLLYKFSSTSDPFLTKLEPSITELIDNPSAQINLGLLDHPIISRDSPYYSYMGSLTTPPCTEGLTWIVDKTLRDVSDYQVNLLRQAMNYTSNSRPVQPINSRLVYLQQPDLIRQVTDNIAQK